MRSSTAGDIGLSLSPKNCSPGERLPATPVPAGSGAVVAGSATVPARSGAVAAGSDALAAGSGALAAAP